MVQFYTRILRKHNLFWSEGRNQTIVRTTRRAASLIEPFDLNKSVLPIGSGVSPFEGCRQLKRVWARKALDRTISRSS